VQIVILPARSLAHNHIYTWCISHSNPMNLHGTKSTIEFAYRFYQSVIYIILPYMYPHIAVKTVTLVEASVHICVCKGISIIALSILARAMRRLFPSKKKIANRSFLKKLNVYFAKVTIININILSFFFTLSILI
jgi:hypothetical protein